MSHVATRLLLAMIRLYQCCLAPFLGHCCRFTPSCSHYAAAAVTQHGAFKGSLLAAKRVLRCNPFAKSGLDPVPVKHPNA